MRARGEDRERGRRGEAGRGRPVKSGFTNTPKRRKFLVKSSFTEAMFKLWVKKKNGPWFLVKSDVTPCEVWLHKVCEVWAGFTIPRVKLLCSIRIREGIKGSTGVVS